MDRDRPVQRSGIAIGSGSHFWGGLIRAYDEFEERVATVSRDMVRHVLRQMRDEGIVRVEGTGRGAKWRGVDV